MIDILLDVNLIECLLKTPKEVGAFAYEEEYIQYYRSDNSALCILTIINNNRSELVELRYVNKKFSTIDYNDSYYYFDGTDFTLQNEFYSEKDFNDPAFQFNLEVLGDESYKFFKLFKSLKNERSVLNIP